MESKGIVVMKMYKSKTWQHEVTGSYDTILFGKSIFKYTWKETGEIVLIKDSFNNQICRLSIYTVNIDGESHSFAAGEFSNCQWRFYLFRY